MDALMNVTLTVIFSPQLRDRVSELEALLVAAQEEIEKRDEVIKELIESKNVHFSAVDEEQDDQCCDEKVEKEGEEDEVNINNLESQSVADIIT